MLSKILFTAGLLLSIGWIFLFLIFNKTSNVHFILVFIGILFIVSFLKIEKEN